MGTTANNLGRPMEILLAEDSPSDAGLTKAALDKELDNRTYIVEDGEKAIAFLRQQGDYADVPRPDLVLLDLNMPRKGGLEVLKEVRADPQLCDIPIIILTTSDDREDVTAAYRLHANCFITKPVQMSQFYEVIRSFKDFWIRFVQLPSAAQ